MGPHHTVTVTMIMNMVYFPPLELPPESLDEKIWILERYQSNDDNNNSNYNDIDKEILQFKYEDPIGESETIVLHDCDDDLNATQQEKGNTELEWTLKKYQVNNDNTADTKLEWILKKYQVDNVTKLEWF